MSPHPIIMKFGGTSVEDANAFRNVTTIVSSAIATRPVVVVSAIGGFTNQLLASVETAVDGDARAATRLLEDGFQRHLAIANELFADAARRAFESAVLDARREIRQLHKIIAAHPVTAPPLQDEIVAYGEHLSSQLLAAVLEENGLAAQYVDARRCITTDGNYGSATPLPQTAEATEAEVRPLLA